MLFLELFLVRWISTEIRIFAYASNLVLLACFIGIGAGCYFSNRRINILFVFLMLAIATLSVKSAPFVMITDLLGGFQDSVIWSPALISTNLIPALKGIALTLFMFGIIASIFFPLGQALASMFSSHDKIVIAYSFNVLGSIIGIWLFSLLSFIYTPPLIWLILAMACGLIFIEKKARTIQLFLLLFLFSSVIITISFNRTALTLWSPYQKLDVYKINTGSVDMGYTVNVNNANYMELLNISPDFIKSHPEIFGSNAGDLSRFGQYEIPYMFKEGIEDILIVGSGGGNDVAGALRRDIKNIDAVEIDPGIYKLGLMFHPEHPYGDKRARIYIDDARSFFKKAKKKYDLISFGLLDSHTVSSSYNNIRLDHYMYTLESFKEAKALLKDDGVMTLAFAATKPWIAERLYNLLKEAFGEEPVCFAISPYGNDVFNRGWIMYVIDNNMGSLRKRIDSQPLLRDYIKRQKINLTAGNVKSTTDDWPYFYVEKPIIPKMYLCIIISLLALLILAGRALFSQGKKINLHFLFLGAAFLLLEFQNISKASLVFGATWLVNAYMITAILALILLANLFVRYFKIRDMRPFYYLLWVSILIIYLVPLHNLNVYNYYFKATFIAIFLNIPIFFAGVIFINSFKRHPHKDIALGSNLLGASLGGLLESLSFVVGIKALLILVFALYFLAYLFGRGLILAKDG